MDLRTPGNLTYDSVRAARQVATTAAIRADEQDRADGFPTEDVADLDRPGLLAAPIPDEGGVGLGEEPGASELAPDRIVAFVNLARLTVERAGLDVLQLAQRSFGLHGFLREHPLERLSRDLATYLRQPAPDRALTTAAETLGADGIASGLFEVNSAR